MKWLPGDPFSEEQSLRSEVHKTLMNHYGYNKSVISQYGDFVLQLSRGNFGSSLKYPGRSVIGIIKETFPISAQLGVQTFFFSLLVGIALGSFSALSRNSWNDRCLIFVTTFGISIPSFILAAFLQYSFSIYFPLFPIARWESFAHTILPTLALSATPIAFIMRLVRTHMNEVLKTDYVKLSLAKGLPFKNRFFSYILPNAILPLFSYLGPLLANVLIGSFIVEKIFSIPGLGIWFVESVSSRDYPLIMGLTMFYSFILLLAIFCFDVLYACCDPRIRVMEKTHAS